MNDLTREAFLNANAPVVKKIKVPGIEGDVYIRQITGEEQDQYIRDNVDAKPDRNARIIVMGLSDKDGNRLLKDSDVEAVSKGKSSVTIQALVSEISKINIYSPEDIEGLAKN